MWSKYGWWRLCCYAGLSGSSADGSDQMSDCEQFAQITQDKWATVSESLRLLMTNELMSELLVCLSESLVRAFAQKKQGDHLKKLTKIIIFVTFFVLLNAHSLFFNEQCERIAQVSHKKWGMWANRSGRSPKISEWANWSIFWANRSLAHYSLSFLQKTSDLLRKPMSEFQPWLVHIPTVYVQ